MQQHPVQELRTQGIVSGALKKLNMTRNNPALAVATQPITHRSQLNRLRQSIRIRFEMRFANGRFQKFHSAVRPSDPQPFLSLSLLLAIPTFVPLTALDGARSSSRAAATAAVGIINANRLARMKWGFRRHGGNSIDKKS